MNIQQIIISAIVTTLGLIVITEVWGKRRANFVGKVLLFISIAPLLLVIAGPVISYLINSNNTSDLGPAASKEIALLPGFLLSSYIGDAIGGAIFGVYRWVKHPFGWRRRRRF